MSELENKWGSFVEKTAEAKVYAYVDKNAVTFWTLVPLGFNTNHTTLVSKAIMKADLEIGEAWRTALHGMSAEARDLAESVQDGHRVLPTGRVGALVVFTDFYREGGARTPEQLYNMTEYLRGAGFGISVPPMQRLR
jgi:hypothetical protein